MLKQWTKVLPAVIAVSCILFSCKKQSSPDNPVTPVYAPSIIISSDNHVVYAFDPQTGAQHWQYTIPYNSIGSSNEPSSPLLYNEIIYLGVATDTLYTLNAKTGALNKKMHFCVPYTSVIGTPLADNGVVYVPCDNDTLYAIDATSGALRWAYDAGSPIHSSPVIYDSLVVFGTEGGHVVAVKKANAITQWIFSATGKFTSSPATNIDSFLYIGCTDGNMYCLNAKDGTQKWSFHTNGAIYSSPTAYQGSCIFGSDDSNVYCIDTATGAQRWVVHTSERVRSSPYAYNQTIYIGSYDYNLYAISIHNGNVKWKHATQSLIYSSPVGYGSKVYVGSYDKYLYALDTASGNTVWKQLIGGNIECSPVIDDFSNATGTNSGISGLTQ